MKKIKFGLISLCTFFISVLILFFIVPSIHYTLTNFMIGISFFGSCASFVFSILALLKNKNIQAVLGIITIPFSLILLLFCCAAYEQNYLSRNRYDKDNYFIENNMKIYYSLGDGYFDYYFENGELKYDISMGGDGGPGPYYDYLFPHNHEPLITLEQFLDFYGYKYSIDENQKLTTIHLDKEDIKLFWGSSTAEYSKSGKKIKLDSPIIHRTCNDAYSYTNDSRIYTFISVSFLNEAGFLKKSSK